MNALRFTCQVTLILAMIYFLGTKNTNTNLFAQTDSSQSQQTQPSPGPPGPQGPAGVPGAPGPQGPSNGTVIVNPPQQPPTQVTYLGMDPTVAVIVGIAALLIIVILVVAFARSSDEHTHHTHS